MKKLLLIAVVVFAGCANREYYAAPSGHYQDGIPDGAEVIVATEHDRYYKYKDCFIKQYWSQGGWVTSSVECTK